MRQMLTNAADGSDISFWIKFQGKEDDRIKSVIMRLTTEHGVKSFKGLSSTPAEVHISCVMKEGRAFDERRITIMALDAGFELIKSK